MKSISIEGQRFVTDFVIGVNVGDIIKRNLLTGDFEVIQNLRDGIADLDKFITTARGSKDDLTSQDDTNVSVKLNTDASVPGIAQGAIGIHFTKQDSSFYALHNVTYEHLDYPSIQDRLNTFWSSMGYYDLIIRREMILVTTVALADSGTYVYSMAADTLVELSASGTVPIGATATSLALSGGLTMEIKKGAAKKVDFSQSSGALFKGNIRLPLGWQLID